MNVKPTITYVVVLTDGAQRTRSDFGDSNTMLVTLIWKPSKVESTPVFAFNVR